MFCSFRITINRETSDLSHCQIKYTYFYIFYLFVFTSTKLNLVAVLIILLYTKPRVYWCKESD